MNHPGDKNDNVETVEGDGLLLSSGYSHIPITTRQV